jgi:hypothetical protein
MARMLSPRRYLATLLAVCATGAAVIAAINFVIDPYLLFDRPRISGLNAVKPAAETHERMMKSYQSRRHTVQTVVLGSSRTDIGIDPRSPAWKDGMAPVYNLSLIGADLRTNLRYLQHLSSAAPNDAPAAEAPARWVVIGLDFESFLFRPAMAPARPSGQVAPNPPDEDMLRLQDMAASALLPGSQLLKDGVAGLLTIDALGDSLATLQASRSKRPSPDLEPTGRFSEGRLREWTATDGVEALFAQKHLLTARQYVHPRQVLSHAPDAPMRELAAFEALVAHAHAHRYALIVALQPAHASRLELLAQMGYWNDFERWKRELTGAVSRAQARGVEVVLWDFAGHEDPVQERVPKAEDAHRPMTWFWDPVHYTTALGDRMVRAMTTGQAAGFGARLEPHTLEDRLTQVRLQRQRYLQQHPQVVDHMRALVCKVSGCAGDSAP